MLSRDSAILAFRAKPVQNPRFVRCHGSRQDNFHENVNIAYTLCDTSRGVERHVLSFRCFPAALLRCRTRHLYTPCFVVQLLGDLYENVTYEASVVEALFRMTFCTKTSARYCTECGLALCKVDEIIVSRFGWKEGFIYEIDLEWNGIHTSEVVPLPVTSSQKKCSFLYWERKEGRRRREWKMKR